MKKLWIILPILFLAYTASADNLPIITQAGGINADDHPLYITNNGMAKDSQNVVTDETPGRIELREGYVIRSTEPSKALWTYYQADGDKYLINHNPTENTIEACTSSNYLFNLRISTVAETIKTVGAVLGDKFYFSNVTDGLKSWDGATTVSVSTSLKFSSLVAGNGRLWGAGISGEETIIYVSKHGDGDTWDLVADPADNDPAQLVTGGALGDPLTGLFGTHRGNVYWMKDRAHGAIIGTKQNLLKVVTYSDEIGSIYPETWKDCNGELQFLGSDKRVYSFDGAQIRVISELKGKGIRKIMDTISQGSSGNHTFIDTTQEDFEAGTLDQSLDTTSMPGSIICSTGGFVDISTSIIEGNISNYSFESGTASWSHTGNGSGSTTTLFNGQAHPNGSYILNVGSTTITAPSGYTLIKNSVGSTLKALTNFPSSGNHDWAKYTIDLTDYDGQIISIYFQTYAGSLETEQFVCSGTSMTFYNSVYSDGTYRYHAFDFFESGKLTSGSTTTYTSGSFDTGMSSPTWLASTPIYISNGNTIVFETQVSTSSYGTWDSLATWTPGSAPASAKKRYIRYKVTITTSADTTGTAIISEVPIDFSPRIFESQSFATDPQISQFGTFSAGYENDGGSHTFVVYTDTNSSRDIENSKTFTSSQAVTSGSLITLSSAAYIAYVDNFNRTVSTQNPTLNYVQIDDFIGRTILSHSIFDNGRYFLPVAISSTSNNYTLVFDRNKEWQKWTTDIDSEINFRGNHFFGNSTGIYEFGIGYNDNGSDIASYFETGYFATAGANKKSRFKNLWITTESGNATLETTYTIDGYSGTSYNLSDYEMNQEDGIQDFKLPFPTTQIKSGKFIGFKFSVTGQNHWSILQSGLEYSPFTLKTD